MEKNKILKDFLCSLLGGYFGLHYFINKEIGKGILYLFTLGLFGFGWLIDTIKLAIQLIKCQKPQVEQTVQQNNIVSKTPIVNTSPDKNVKTNFNNDFFDILPNVYENCFLKYQYTDNICIFDKSVIKEVYGKGVLVLDIKPEPDNPHDSGALAIYYQNLRLGYVYNGFLHKMISDWIRKEQLFYTHIYNVNLERQTIEFIIGFYVSSEKFESRTFPIVKISKKSTDNISSRFDNISLVEAGDEVELSHIDDAYIVSNCGAELGELPKSANSFLDDREYFAVIEKVDEDYCADKVTAKVKVYFKD